MAEHLRRAQPDSVANHVKARQSLIDCAVTWLAIESGWARRKHSVICSGKLCKGFTIFEQCSPCGQDDGHRSKKVCVFVPFGSYIMHHVFSWNVRFFYGGTAWIYLCKTCIWGSSDQEQHQRTESVCCLWVVSTGLPSVAFVVAKQVNIEGSYILVIGARADASLHAVRRRCCNCSCNVYFASVDGQRMWVHK